MKRKKMLQVIENNFGEIINNLYALFILFINILNCY